jgi:hypothetical protein
MPKSDSKVFEVNIRVFGSDPDLRPAMTTGNIIQTGYYTDKLFVPSEAVYGTDSTRFVYLKKDEVVRQLVDVGEENEDYVIVNKGVAENDVLLLNEPEKLDDIKTVGWEIYEEQMQKLRENKLNNKQSDSENFSDTIKQEMKITKDRKSGNRS